MRTKFFTLLLAVHGLALGVNPDFKLHQYAIRSWTRANGDPLNIVYAMAISKDGYIWLGNHKGSLYRFDGNDFTKVETGLLRKDGRPSSIFTLYEDSKGRLWIGTLGAGAAVMDKGRIVARITKNPQALTDYIDSFMEDPKTGGMWIGTRAGLLYWKDGAQRWYTKADGLPDTVIMMGGGFTPDGTLWLPTRFGGVVRMRGGKFDSLGIAQGLADLETHSIHIDRGGRVWAATREGLSLWDGKRFQTWLGKEQTGLNTLWAMLQDRDDNFWFGGPWAAGPIRFRNGKVERFPPATGLAESTVYVIAEDREGTIWMATGDGIRQVRDTTFRTFGVLDGLRSERARAVLINADGSLLVNNFGASLSHFKKDGVTVYAQKDNIPKSNFASWTRAADGSVYVTFDSGELRRLVSPTWRAVPAPGAPVEPLQAIHAARDGSLWLAPVRGGLYRLRHGKLENVAGLDAPTRGVCEDPAGRLWIGTHNGVYLWSEGKIRPVWSPRIEATIRVYKMVCEPSGSVWVTSHGGEIIRYYKGAARNFGLKDGLYDVKPGSVMREDPFGGVWWFGERGLHRARLADFDQVMFGNRTAIPYETWDTSDGLGSDAGGELLDAIAFNRNGDGWFASSRGLSFANVKNLTKNRHAPPVVIERLTADDRAIPLENAVLKAGVHRVGFQFTALTYILAERAQFRYKLEGFDRDWVDAGTKRIAEYTSLPPGRYRFVVKASNSDGLWNDVGASVWVTQRPFFYQTFWFGLLCAIGILALAFAAYRLRVRRLKHEYSLILAERVRVARELHDTLLQGFQALTVVLDGILRRSWDDPETIRVTLRDSVGYARTSLSEARRAVHDLRAETDGAGLIETLCSAVNMARESQTNGPNCSLNIVGQPYELPPSIDNTFRRIGVEAFSNAVRHSHASNIILTVVFGEGTLALSVKDDGIGFDHRAADSRHDGAWGITGMRERAARFGYRFDIQSRIPGGTEVTLTASFDRRSNGGNSILRSNSMAR